MRTAGPHAFDPASVDFQLFALFLDARRVHRRKTVRRVSIEAQVPVDSVQRAMRARNSGEDEFFALCTWIGEPPTLFIRDAARAEGRKPDRTFGPLASPAGEPAAREAERKAS